MPRLDRFLRKIAVFAPIIPIFPPAPLPTLVKIVVKSGQVFASLSRFQAVQPNGLFSEEVFLNVLQSCPDFEYVEFDGEEFFFKVEPQYANFEHTILDALEDAGVE